MRPHPLSFLLIPVLFLFMQSPLQASADAISPQTCSRTDASPCPSFTTFFPSANHRLADIARLFSLPSFSSLLGPNNFNLSLPGLSGQSVVPALQAYNIPQTCGCGVTGQRVVTSVNYTVVSGDTLSTIAGSDYNGLVTYQEIAAANSISNPNLILVGQVFSIPIPCACFNRSNAGGAAAFLSYQVQSGDTLSGIANAYHTTTANLETLNGLTNSSIKAASVLFLPLSVCKANFSEGALDKDMVVVEGRYELTANNCVQCRCTNGTLYCTPTPSSFGSSCGNLTCKNSALSVGSSNVSRESNDCSITSCVYKGYTSAGILLELEREVDPTCPAPPPPESLYNFPSGLAASPINSPPTTSSSSSSSPPPPSPTTSGNATAPPPSSPASSNKKLGMGIPLSLLLLIFWPLI